MSSLQVKQYRKYLGKLNETLTDEQVAVMVKALDEFINMVWELYNEQSKSGDLLQSIKSKASKGRQRARKPRSQMPDLVQK